MVKGKDKNTILTEIRTSADPGSVIHEQQKMGIIVRCTEDLERSLHSLETTMNKNAVSSDSLARKVFWLNVVLTAATAIGTLLAVYKLFLEE